PASTLRLARRLAWLRAGEPVLQTGEQRSLDAGPDVLAWLRIGEAATYLAAVNFAAAPRRLRRPPDLAAEGDLVLSTAPARDEGRVVLDGLELAPGEGILVRL